LRGPFIGEIAPFPTPTLPAGWMPCDGRTLQIRDYMTLFSIIGTMYGGDGSTNFALPNLSGRAPIGAGLPRYSGPKSRTDREYSRHGREGREAEGCGGRLRHRGQGDLPESPVMDAAANRPWSGG
jgi:hypothetical protein